MKKFFAVLFVLLLLVPTLAIAQEDAAPRSDSEPAPVVVVEQEPADPDFWQALGEDGQAIFFIGALALLMLTALWLVYRSTPPDVVIGMKDTLQSSVDSAFAMGREAAAKTKSKLDDILVEGVYLVYGAVFDELEKPPNVTQTRDLNTLATALLDGKPVVIPESLPIDEFLDVLNSQNTYRKTKDKPTS